MAEPIQKRGEKISALSQRAEKPEEKPKSIHTRVGFFSRMVGHVVDICLVISAITLFGPPDLLTMVVTAYIYFFVCDVFMGRTLGKLLLGFYYLDKNEQPVPKPDLTKRGVLRALNLVAILSWQKTSVLDALTGMRLYQRAKTKKAPGKPVTRRAKKPSR